MENINTQKNKYITVLHSEEDLFNFVKIKKESMKDKKLCFNIGINKWVWGEYCVFENFDFNNKFFEKILEYTNAFRF